MATGTAGADVSDAPLATTRNTFIPSPTSTRPTSYQTTLSDGAAKLTGVFLMITTGLKTKPAKLQMIESIALCLSCLVLTMSCMYGCLSYEVTFYINDPLEETLF